MTDAPAATAPLPSADEHQSYALLDLSDENQIISELEGRIVDKWVYSTPDGDRLSYAGINWAVREYAKQGEALRLRGEPKVLVDPTDPEYIVAIIEVQRFAVDPATGVERALDSSVGSKRKWKKQLLKNGQIVPDPHFLEKALSMAERNAKKKMIPADLIQRIVSGALKKKAGGTAGGGRTPPAGREKGTPASQTAAPAPGKAAPPPSVPAAATPPAQAATPPPASAAPKSGPATADGALSQRIYAALSKVEVRLPGFKGKKKEIWKSLTGLDSTKDATADLAQRFIAAVELCVTSPPIHGLRVEGGGFLMQELVSPYRVVFPEGTEPEPEPAEATGDMF